MNLTDRGYSFTVSAERGRLLGISPRNCATLVWITTQSSNRLTRRRPALLAPNVSVARNCCSSQVSLVKEQSESTSFLSRRSVTMISARICTPMSCRQVARPCCSTTVKVLSMDKRIHLSSFSTFQRSRFFYVGASQSRRRDCASPFTSRHRHLHACTTIYTRVPKRKTSSPSRRSP